MSNLAYNALKIENIRLEFLNKGFSEEAIDFVLLQNDNYNFEVLKEKMNSLEQQIINVEKNFQKDVDSIYIKIDNVNTKIDSVEKALQKDIDSVNTKIDGVEKTLQKDISSLNLKIDGVEKTLQKDISSLDNKIDILKNELNASNRTIQVILIMGITLAPIIYSIFNKYFFN
ncbi:KID repeat protein (plasmid) [Borreliella burgdorferi 118a]|uniref:KID repeat protein n=1 Tax=Borreliella burgdorferi 118a TaxID=476210 RepID=A0A7U3YBI8_BORBG|nr:Bdr family repetitive protein [Borreliella burgdorferi]ACN92997.1 KID repeat protein [Borreliella burgdorferi 118a]